MRYALSRVYLSDTIVEKNRNTTSGFIHLRCHCRRCRRRCQRRRCRREATHIGSESSGIHFSPLYSFQRRKSDTNQSRGYLHISLNHDTDARDFRQYWMMSSSCFVKRESELTLCSRVIFVKQLRLFARNAKLIRDESFST